MALQVRALGFVGLAAVLLVHVAADGFVDTSKTPGDVNYWVKLQTLGVSEGQLQPSFDENHADYELEIPNIITQSVTITMGINLDKYNLLHCPVIEVDGEKLSYTPLTIISSTVRLDEDIGPFDRVIKIVVHDPKQGSWLAPTNSMEYRIRMKQPAEYAKVVLADHLVMKGYIDGEPSGEVVAKPPFDPNSSVIDYFFNVPGNYTGVKIEFACSKFSTGVLYDQKEVNPFSPEEGWSPKGTSEMIDATKFSRMRTTFTCLYEDEMRSSRKDYMLTIARNIELSSHLVRPKLMPDVGYCMSRMDYMSQVQSHYLHAQSLPSEEQEGYFCLSNIQDPKIMLDCSENIAKQASVYLIAKGVAFQVQLQCFLPIPIKHDYARRQFTMAVKLGTHHLAFPVNFIFAAECTSMMCPTHYAQRSTLATEVHAEKKLCLAEVCSEETDLDTCCEEEAVCTEMKCGDDHKPDGVFDCHAAVCSDVDYDHCCKSIAVCTSADCPAGSTLRIDHATHYCKEKTCTKDDEETCCVKQAWCTDYIDEYGCGEGEETPDDVKERHCMWDKCSFRDEVHCCGETDTCEGFDDCPEGKVLRYHPEKIRCYGPVCKKSDHHRCCWDKSNVVDNRTVVPKKGTVVGINNDGSYVVNFTDGTQDDSVPEWALHGGGGTSPGGGIKPGDEIIANTAADGYHAPLFCSGWVKKANTDGTYAIRFDNDETDKAVPAWAVRAVDADGNKYVHTGIISDGQRVFTTRREDGSYKRVYSAIGAVVARNDDDTFNIQYASGDIDEHVPHWDLRLIDKKGISHPAADFEAGQNVEVSGSEELKEHTFAPKLRDLVRTMFVFGYITNVNDDQTYGIKYDFGGWENHVPTWAIRKLIVNEGTSRKEMSYKYAERVEARISATTKNKLLSHGVGKMGIAVRERLHLYSVMDCWPEAQECKPMSKMVPWVPPDTPQEVPEVPEYDAVENPDQKMLCFYDLSCQTNPGALGCGDNGAGRPLCRSCGYGDYPKCPKPWHCNATMKIHTKDWPAEKKDWCCQYYNIGCPFVCRWGKYWPSEAHGWGPWWTPAKRTWCCENKGIGCPRTDQSFALITTTITTTITAACPDTFLLTPLAASDCPTSWVDVHPCEQSTPGSFCLGTGACGTRKDLNNCNTASIYQKQGLACPDDQGITGYRFSHAGYWVGGEEAGATVSAADCSKQCDDAAEGDCVGFSWEESGGMCSLYAEIQDRVLGPISAAFLKCPKGSEGMLDLSMKYGQRTSDAEPEQAAGSWQSQVLRSRGLKLASSSMFIALSVVASMAAVIWLFRPARRCQAAPAARSFSMAVSMSAIRSPKSGSHSYQPQPAWDTMLPPEPRDVEDRPLL